jgi:hypothetical protein
MVFGLSLRMEDDHTMHPLHGLQNLQPHPQTFNKVIWKFHILVSTRCIETTKCHKLFCDHLFLSSIHYGAQKQNGAIYIYKEMSVMFVSLFVIFWNSRSIGALWLAFVKMLSLCWEGLRHVISELIIDFLFLVSQAWTFECTMSN